jgi:hypothetical protein
MDGDGRAKALRENSKVASAGRLIRTGGSSLFRGKLAVIQRLEGEGCEI